MRIKNKDMNDYSKVPLNDAGKKLVFFPYNSNGEQDADTLVSFEQTWHSEDH